MRNEWERGMSSSGNPPATKCHKNCHKRDALSQPERQKARAASVLATRAGWSAERAGFEPAVGFYPHAALAKQRADTGSACNSSTSPTLHQLGAAPGAATDPDLARVVAAWPSLPDP